MIPWVVFLIVCFHRMAPNFLKEKVYSGICCNVGLGLSQPLGFTDYVDFCAYPSMGKDGKVDSFLGLLPGREELAVSSRATRSGKGSGPTTGSSRETEPQLSSSRPADPVWLLSGPTRTSQEAQSLHSHFASAWLSDSTKALHISNFFFHKTFCIFLAEDETTLPKGSLELRVWCVLCSLSSALPSRRANS